MKKVTTRFIANDGLWQEIQNHIKVAKKVRAAIAYLGQNGAELLPLKKGHQLVVDMSIGTVRQGATDPREIQKLQKRGVEVFTRGSLHAKFIIVDNHLIASSANVSKNAKEVLDEAGVITTDSAAIRRASDFFDKLCTEPVRAEYLKKCIEVYKPPKFTHGKKKGKKPQERVVEAKLWFLGGLRPLEPHKEDAKSVNEIEEKAEDKLRHPEKTSVNWIQYHRKPKFLDHIRIGDWIVECTLEDKVRRISAPTQVIGQDSFISYNGKKKHMLLLEWPNSSEDISLTKFRQMVRSFEPALDKTSPKTHPIENNEHADKILRLWTSTGRVSQKGK